MENRAQHNPSVTVRNVSKTFDKVHALRNVSLEVKKGEFISFVGPSGCGKTTLLRLIAGLEKPTSGTIEISGEDVSNRAPYERNIGLVFQNYALFPHKTVAANVNFGLRHRTRLAATEREKAIDEGAIDIRDGGTAIPYWDEDPFIRQEYEQILKDGGVPSQMDPSLYVDPLKT